MRALLFSHKEILRKLDSIEKKDIEQDEKILLIFEYLNQLELAKQERLCSERENGLDINHDRLKESTHNYNR